MSIFETVKKLLGIKPVDIGTLNRQATRESLSYQQYQRPKDSLEGIHITDEYKVIQALLEADCPVVFVTGNAGTGKSTLIQYLRTVLKKKLVVLAPTGVAALNVGGVTIHSFFQLPPKIHENKDIRFVYDRKLYQKLDLLIIDEVSMVRCDLMDSVDKFLRINRENDKPFGGVQLLLIGDLFQLPPVVPRPELNILNAMGYKSPYFFSSFSLHKSSLVPIELQTVYRQEDCSFISLLNNLRIGENLDLTLNSINSQCYQRNGNPPNITLVCTNHKADQINMSELGKISNKEYSFMGEIKGHFHIEEEKLPSPINLRLKVGAHVMFTKNDELRRWVNGTLGIVRYIDEKSIGVELGSNHNTMTCDVLPVSWETYKYSYNLENDQIFAEKVGEYRQYPLMLAWAVTIHKSQGKTLEDVLIDLGSGAFASGQVYVALSRCRSLEDIYLARPIRKSDVKCDPLIKRFYLIIDEMKNARDDKQHNPSS
ncbi:MAG: AAA family ATPase [Ignavibacteriales bacterium]|nr:AAA family ATPase [Ignavibacteriales bacterium]